MNTIKSKLFYIYIITNEDIRVKKLYNKYLLKFYIENK